MHLGERAVPRQARCVNKEGRGLCLVNLVFGIRSFFFLVSFLKSVVAAVLLILEFVLLVSRWRGWSGFLVTL